VPDGYAVEEHHKGGQLVFDPDRVWFYLSDDQKNNNKFIVGWSLRRELANMPVMNANVLDFLLANPDLIPEDWKMNAMGDTPHIFFWGTVYRSHVPYRTIVRYLCWSVDSWVWSDHWIGDSWDRTAPAAMYAS